MNGSCIQRVARPESDSLGNVLAAREYHTVGWLRDAGYTDRRTQGRTFGYSLLKAGRDWNEGSSPTQISPFQCTTPAWGGSSIGRAVGFYPKGCRFESGPLQQGESPVPLRCRVEIGGLQGTGHLPHRLAAVAAALAPLTLVVLLVTQDAGHLLAELRASTGRLLLLKKCLKSVPDGAIHGEIESLRDHLAPLASDGEGLDGKFPSVIFWVPEIAPYGREQCLSADANSWLPPQRRSSLAPAWRQGLFRSVLRARWDLAIQGRMVLVVDCPLDGLSGTFVLPGHHQSVYLIHAALHRLGPGFVLR